MHPFGSRTDRAVRHDVAVSETGSTDTKVATRQPWPDLAKAACILLVVVGHTAGSSVTTDGAFAIVNTFWEAVILGLTPIRVPLFFLISGVFACNALRRPMRNARTRLFNQSYLYVLWLAIYSAVFGLGLTIAIAHPDSVGSFLTNLVRPVNTLWYLWALVAYYLLMRLLRDVPWYLTITLGVALSASAAFPVITEVVPGNVLRGFVYFAVGAVVPQLVTWAHRTASAVTLTMALAVFGLGAVGVRALGIGDAPLIPLLNAIPGCWLGVIAATLIARSTFGARIGNYIGPRTMPIYVTHLPLVAVVNWLYAATVKNRWVALDLAYPLIATAIVVAVALSVYAASRRTGLRWFFGVPRWTTSGGATPR